MPSKLQYLTDLRDHPGSTGGEVAARVDSPEPAVLECFRRARKQGLLTGDGVRPEHFTLTEAGLTQLRVMEGESNPKPSLSPNLEKKFSELEEGLSDTQEDIRGLFRLVDDVLSARRESATRDTDTLADELHEQVSTLEEELKKQSRVLEFYAVRLAQAPFPKGKAEMLEARKNALASRLDSDTQQEINRLVSLEANLAEENGKSFWHKPDVSRQLVPEIGRLREKYGFPSMDLGETAESEEAAENAEEDPDAELLR